MAPPLPPTSVFFGGLLLTLVIHCVFLCSAPLNCSLLDVTTGFPLCYFSFFIVRSSFYRSRCRSRPHQPGSFVFCSVLSLFCRFIFIFIDRASFSSFWVVFQFFSFWNFCSEVDVSFFYNLTYVSTLFDFVCSIPASASSSSLF